jgi:hypothetical protein
VELFFEEVSGEVASAPVGHPRYLEFDHDVDHHDDFE